MEVIWEVEDGYVRPARFTCHVPDDELAECETDEERDALIESYVEEDFRQNVTWAIVEKRES